MTGLEPIIAMIVGALIVGSLIYIAYLTFRTITNWIRQKGEKANKHEVGFLLKERLKNGNHKVVYGVFNKKREELVDYEAYEAKEMDVELKREENLVVYQ